MRKEITEKLLEKIATAKSNKALLQTTAAFKNFVEGLEAEGYVEEPEEVVAENWKPMEPIVTQDTSEPEKVLIPRGDPNNPNPVGVWGQAPYVNPNPEPRDPDLAPVPGTGISGPRVMK